MDYIKPENFNLLPPKVQENPSKPKFLILYGSLRERSYSRFLAHESAKILNFLGAEVEIYNPDGLPTFDYHRSQEHAKVTEIREKSLWSDGHVWVSPEIHGNISGLMKTQIDWIPLSVGALRPTQGRTLALMQVSGGSQSFNAVNSMRLLGRWMRMFTTPNQSSVAKAYQEFDEAGRMRESSYRDRVVDVLEELMRFTYLLRPHKEFLVDRYSERKQKGTIA